MFRQWVGIGDTVGDEFTFLKGKARREDVRFEPTIEPGIVRSMNANALLEGELEIMYEGWPRMTMGPGFDVSNEHTKLWQSGPVAPMHATVLAAPAVWWCAKARRQDELLEVAFQNGDSGESFLFAARADPTYVVPLLGSATSSRKLGRYSILDNLGMGPIEGTFDEDGTVVAFIWSR